MGAGIVVLITAFFLTVSVIKDVDKKIQTYEANGDSLKDELERSYAYEKNSLKTNVKSLTVIYSIICLALIIFSLWFIFI